MATEEVEWVYSRRGDRYRRGPGPWCGTTGGYKNHHCHCDACTAANRAGVADYMARHPEQVEKKRVRDAARRLAQGMTPRPPRVPDPRCPIGYGNRNGYIRHGCRCDYCRAAHTAYGRRRRAAK